MNYTCLNDGRLVYRRSAENNEEEKSAHQTWSAFALQMYQVFIENRRARICERLLWRIASSVTRGSLPR